mmetsp:Transcript_7176/g.28981  ORF Transcript_7176/g.28981 Transcript_7176/m.28981 type:complete len:89 (+) Transcript_7176:46-312(+)
MNEKSLRYRRIRIERKNAVNHRMLVRASVLTVLSPAPETGDFMPGKTFQKRNVSSPAPVTMVWPSGEMARKSTRRVWPVSVVSLDILG